MPTSLCYLFKNAMEYRPASDIGEVPDYTRGIYVLYKAGHDIMNKLVRKIMATPECYRRVEMGADISEEVRFRSGI